MGLEGAPSWAGGPTLAAAPGPRGLCVGTPMGGANAGSLVAAIAPKGSEKAAKASRMQTRFATSQFKANRSIESGKESCGIYTQ